MIDMFSIVLSHGLMLIAAWRLLTRLDLDPEDPLPPEAATGRKHRKWLDRDA